MNLTLSAMRGKEGRASGPGERPGRQSARSRPTARLCWPASTSGLSIGRGWGGGRSPYWYGELSRNKTQIATSDVTEDRTQFNVHEIEIGSNIRSNLEAIVHALLD